MKILRFILIATLFCAQNVSSNQNHINSNQPATEGGKCQLTPSSSLCSLAEYVTLIQETTDDATYELIADRIQALELKKFLSVKKTSLAELTDFINEFKLVYYHRDPKIKGTLQDSAIRSITAKLRANASAQKVLSGGVEDYKKYVEHKLSWKLHLKLVEDLIALSKGPGFEEYIYYKLRHRFAKQHAANAYRYTTHYKAPQILLNSKWYSITWSEAEVTIQKKSHNYRHNFNFEHMKTHCSTNPEDNNDLWIYNANDKQLLGKVQCLELAYSKQTPLSIRLKTDNKEIFDNYGLLFSTFKLSTGLQAQRAHGTSDDLELVNQTRKKFGVLTVTEQLPEKYIFENDTEIIFAIMIDDINCEWVCQEYVILFKNTNGEIEELGHITSTGLRPYLDLDGDGFPEFIEITDYELTIMKLYPTLRTLYAISFI